MSEPGHDTEIDVLVLLANDAVRVASCKLTPAVSVVVLSAFDVSVPAILALAAVMVLVTESDELMTAVPPTVRPASDSAPAVMELADSVLTVRAPDSDIEPAVTAVADSEATVREDTDSEPVLSAV